MIMLKSYIKNKFLEIKWHKKRIKIAKNAIVSISSVFGGNNKINSGSNFSGVIGRHSYIGRNSHIYGKVGKFCSIGSDVKVIIATHPVHTFVSTSPVFYSLKKQCGVTFSECQCFDENLSVNDKFKGIKIGNDVWIGDNVLILGNVEIGDGAIIAAGSVVTKNVNPYCIIGGNPAKIIRYRFEDKTIEILLKSKWWNQSDYWLKTNIGLLRSIESFVEHLN